MKFYFAYVSFSFLPDFRMSRYKSLVHQLLMAQSHSSNTSQIELLRCWFLFVLALFFLPPHPQAGFAFLFSGAWERDLFWEEVVIRGEHWSYLESAVPLFFWTSPDSSVTILYILAGRKKEEGCKRREAEDRLLSPIGVRTLRKWQVLEDTAVCVL